MISEILKFMGDSPMLTFLLFVVLTETIIRLGKYACVMVHGWNPYDYIENEDKEEN